MDFKDAFAKLTAGMPEFTKEDKGPSAKKRRKMYGKKDSTIEATSKTKPLEKLEEIKCEALVNSLKRMGIETPTPVQSACIPLMSPHKHLVACAPTGSGKTLAYLIPVLRSLYKKPLSVQSGAKFAKPYCIILAPTQELVRQIWSVAIQLNNTEPGKSVRFVYLQQKKGKSAQEKRTVPLDATILIGTIHKVAVLFSKKASEREISLKRLKYVVIDECDKLLEVNVAQRLKQSATKPSAGHFRHQAFRDQILPIFTSIKKAGCLERPFSFCLFSATVKPEIREWMSRELVVNGKQPVIENVHVGSKNVAVSTVDQELKYCATEEGKLLEIQNMLLGGFVYPCLIFLESRERAKDIYNEIMMSDSDILAEVISGEKSDKQRAAITKAFREAKLNVLICTDLLGRGIDFKGVAMVVNYDAPVTVEDYIHRVGRTGRAGQAGRAVTFWTDADLPHMHQLIAVVRASNPRKADSLERLQQLVDSWLKRRTEKMQSKKALQNKRPNDKFVVSNRRGERKLASHVLTSVSEGKLDANYSEFLRPWNPNRKRIRDVPGSHIKHLRDSADGD